MNKEANAKRLLAIQARFAKATKGPWTLLAAGTAVAAVIYVIL
jgi:hypothetical protein